MYEDRDTEGEIEKREEGMKTSFSNFARRHAYHTREKKTTTANQTSQSINQSNVFCWLRIHPSINHRPALAPGKENKTEDRNNFTQPQEGEKAKASRSRNR